LALIVVGGIAIGGLFAMRRYLPTMALKAVAAKRLKLLETMRLTPKTTVFLVQFDNTTLLLGQHGDSLSVLASNPPDSRADSETNHV
jgi:flagellar biogenesis protein FliO